MLRAPSPPSRKAQPAARYIGSALTATPFGKGLSHKAIVLSQIPETCRASLCSEAYELGYAAHVAETRNDIAAIAQRVEPALAIVYTDTRSSGDAIEECSAWQMHVVALTDAPCLVRAAGAIRRGAAAVLARPATFAQALATLGGQPQEDPTPMSLDRAIWEYLNQTLIETGSIAGAARRLKLDRTSFKRMLRKRPF